MKRLFCLLLVAGSSFAAELPRHVATTSVLRTDAHGKERTQEVLEHAREMPDAQFVFPGDSITELWRANDAGGKLWAREWKPRKALNLGVGGDRTEHVLWLDVGTEFLKANGDPDIVPMPDLLHLSSRGYRVWNDALVGAVKAMLTP